MQIAKKSMNWFPKESAWEQAQRAKEKRRVMMEEFQQKNAALAASFENAFTMQIQGNVENIARTATDRVHKQAEAKRQELLKKFEAFA